MNNMIEDKIIEFMAQGKLGKQNLFWVEKELIKLNKPELIVKFIKKVKNADQEMLVQALVDMEAIKELEELKGIIANDKLFELFLNLDSIEDIMDLIQNNEKYEDRGIKAIFGSNHIKYIYQIIEKYGEKRFDLILSLINDYQYYMKLWDNVSISKQEIIKKTIIESNKGEDIFKAINDKRFANKEELVNKLVELKDREYLRKCLALDFVNKQMIIDNLIMIGNNGDLCLILNKYNTPENKIKIKKRLIILKDDEFIYQLLASKRIEGDTQLIDSLSVKYVYYLGYNKCFSGIVLASNILKSNNEFFIAEFLKNVELPFEYKVLFMKKLISLNYEKEYYLNKLKHLYMKLDEMMVDLILNNGLINYCESNPLSKEGILKVMLSNKSKYQEQINTYCYFLMNNEVVNTKTLIKKAI